MKKLSIIFVSLLTLGLTVTSCNKDDDDEASIEGKWEATQFGNVIEGKELLLPVTNEGGCANDIIEITNDGKYKMTSSEFIDSKCSSSTDTGTWAKSDNTLKFTDDESKEVDSVEILELSDSTLKIKYTDTEDGATIINIEVYTRK